MLNGAVIGTGAIVTHDVAPYTIVAGTPAKKMRKRFPDAIWHHIEDISWWDWDHQTIKARIDDFRDIRKFIALYGNTP